MAEAVFQYVRVSVKRFEGASIVLDKTWFENCSFENCEVFYSGPTEARSRRFDVGLAVKQIASRANYSTQTVNNALVARKRSISRQRAH